ncbi:MAG TPA: cytochrome c biogenesis protein CcsA [Bryobacteraceae bacterium]|jgi:ABC-type transport system involved in cytochrome c biogenesis permease subunit|nr:cytochrome c biogenesis protein CcsA [Bryobacteraceae bacterium]
MHETGVLWLRVAAVLYSVGLAHAVTVVTARRNTLFPAALFAFYTGVVLQIVAVVESSLALGHLPVNNFFETISLCALIIGISFLIVYLQYRFSSLSVFIFPVVFLMTLIGSMETPIASWPNTRLRDAWLLLHVVLILLGYAGLLLTAVGSIFYLIQERQLKRKRPSALFDRLPPLATLDSLITHAMSFGFLFITLGVIAAITWAFIETGSRWIGYPRIGLALLTWLVYLLMVFLRATAGWRGRKAAVMAITVLCCAALTWAAHVGLRSILEQ